MAQSFTRPQHVHDLEMMGGAYGELEGDGT